MKHYDSIPRIQDDGTLKGDVVWGFNKLDGQNFCATFKPKANRFVSFGSRCKTRVSIGIFLWMRTLELE